MEIADNLINYFNSNIKIHEDISQLIDANKETYFVDLESISLQNLELHAQIQSDFVNIYDILKSTFKNFTLNKWGRQLNLSFYNPSIKIPLRKLSTTMLGTLVQFKGTATRSSQVRPELFCGIFKCKDCNSKIGPIIQNYKYTQPLFCPNALCTNRTKYEIDLKESTFRNWQKLNVQEPTNEVPDGSLPRAIEIIIRDEIVESINPGSTLTFTGYVVAIPHLLFNISGSGMIGQSSSMPILEGVAEEKGRRVGRDLNFKMVFYCIHADTSKKEEEFTEIEHEIIRKMQVTENLYEKLYTSLFPTIYGHENIKAAILLMMVGGSINKNVEGMKIRGDINLLLVGDPGTAKSQFLKHVSEVIDNAIYTSGKSSTAAGLTAAVVRDGETGEFTIEAGALMLADNGICCIDEFDKMNLKDQVAIHEAMEQQTITISKAGINASLNSRTSILAAANPIRGKYDKRRNLRQNINLSAPIMSRFDLYFVLIDEVDERNDRRISKAILNNHLNYHFANKNAVHNFSSNNSGGSNSYATLNSLNSLNTFSATSNFNAAVHPFTIDEVVLYIKYVKTQRPVLSETASELLVAKYIALRQDSLKNTGNYKMTARHLESLIRISEALAKIHNDPFVSIPHIEEAYRLIQSSVVEVCGDDIRMVTQQDSQPFIIKNKDYLKIMNSLIYLIKISKLTKEELILKYLELIEQSISGVEQLEIERVKCERTIDFLIENEGVIYIVEDLVYVHPDYDN